MLRRISTISILSFLLVAMLAMTAFSARTAYENAKKIDHKIDKSIYYAYPDETVRQDGASSSVLGRSTYSKNSASASPGVSIGDTWYDYQHNGTIGRMIDWGMNGDTVLVHFGWMRLQQPSFTDRHYGYSHYNAATGLTGAVVPVQPAGDYGGYVNLAVTGDNKGIPGGHNIVGNVGATQTQIYWDFAPGFGFFNDQDRVDDSVATYGAGPAVQNVIWPKFAYQEGTQTVTHVIAQVSAPNAADPQAIYYFRKVGAINTGSWDYPPYVIDTIYDLSHDITASQTSDKVAMAWTANLTYTGVGNAQHPLGFQDDTLSGESPIHVQWDNDVYYQTSDDQGATWNNRVNITKNRLGEAGYRAYTDLATLIDSNDDLHVAWSGPAWPEDPAADGWSGFYCRLFMWSENLGVVRTVASAEWSTPEVDTLIECVTGAWNVAMAKMQVSECDGKLYVLWTQHLDPPNGIYDDCAARADGGNGDAVGATNGELFVSVSADYGLTYDAPRNLTNSYSKDCDPANGGLDCDADNWPSMARFGRANQAGEDWTGAVVVDPSGSFAGNSYLDVQYIHDVDAGGIVQNEGTWQNADVNWFRLACVEPVPNPQIILSRSSVQFPTWAKPGQSISLDLQIENTGNVDLSYTTSVEMDNNAGMNWMSLSGFSGLTPSGLSNVETGSIGLGSGSTTVGGYNGRLIFTSNAPTSPDTIPVVFTVADTIIPMEFDTVESACLALVVANTGNYGNGGGGPSMDWVFSGAECDTSGAADVYLYDGSPVISWIDGVDTVAYWSIFGDGWLATNGFKPTGLVDDAACSGSEANYNWYISGKFVTPDSTIGMSKSWFASTNAGNCDFIVQKLSIWSEDGSAKSGIAIGEAIDWDIPSDSGAQNTDGFSPIPNLIYQSGAEFGVDTVCQDSDTRFGGVAFFEGYTNGTLSQTAPAGAYTGRNDSLVFPAGNFVPSQLYTNMQNTGFTTTGQTTDLHTVMTFNNSLSLGATDTVEYWIVMATVQDGTVADLETAIADGKAFITANSYFPAASCGGGGGCCTGIRGNVDGDGADAIDIADLVYFVSYSFGGGPAPVCFEEADMDASLGLDIGDIVYLVTYSFGGGPAPLPCP